MKECTGKRKMDKSSDGFTLIEVLVSIALIGITAISILGIHSTFLQNNMISKETIKNTVAAKDIMENVKSKLARDDYKISEIINYYERKYPKSKISIKEDPLEGLYKKGVLYRVEIKVPGIRKGSIEEFVSKIYILDKE